MSVKERIDSIQMTEGKVFPSSKIQILLGKSNIEDIVNELFECAPVNISKEFTLNGKKAIIEVTWPLNTEAESYNRFVISINEDSISFIGNPIPEYEQYLRLEDNDMFNSDLIEFCVARTFLNPIRINKVVTTESTTINKAKKSFFDFLHYPWWEHS